MTTEDQKFKIISAFSIVLLISVMGVYESRKQDSIEKKVDSERKKMEEIIKEKVEQEVRMFQLRNSDPEKSGDKREK